MSTEGIMLSCMIDAIEGREVATAEIPGAFLQTDYDKGDIHIKLEGAMVTLLEEIDPEYYKDLIFTDKRGRKCMHVESTKVIYGTLEASLLLFFLVPGGTYFLLELSHAVHTRLRKD